MTMKLNEDDARWVEKTFDDLSLREKIGQLLIPCLTTDTSAPLSVGGMCERHGVGGGHMFHGSLESRRALAQEVWAASKVPPLISGDLESGAGDRAAEATRFSSQLALGATDDERLARRMGEAIGVEGLALGYNWAFGPMVDICGHRDYLRQTGVLGAEPERVSRLACALIDGMQAHGMAACAKHFPGDGFDDRDQHLTAPVNPLSRDDWYALSAEPFRAAIAGGVYSIMNTDISVPSIDPVGRNANFVRPAVLSPVLTREILREEFGFEGVIVTDALTMAGMTMYTRRPELYLESLLAGNDALLFVRRVDESLDYLEGCVADGRLPQAMVEESCRRVLVMKARMGLHRGGPPAGSDDECREFLSATPYRADAKEVAERSITLLYDSRDLVPLKLKEGARLASVLITHQERFTLDDFDETLRAAGYDVTSIRNPQTDEMHDRVAAGEFDAVIVSLFYPSPFGWATARCHGPESRCLMSGFTLAHADVPAVFISFANPFHIYEFAFMDPYMVTYGGARETQKAAARALTGQIPIVGKSPARLEGYFEVGAGIERQAAR